MIQVPGTWESLTRLAPTRPAATFPRAPKGGAQGKGRGWGPLPSTTKNLPLKGGQAEGQGVRPFSGQMPMPAAAPRPVQRFVGS
jgi:hypothetical protein